MHDNQFVAPPTPEKNAHCECPVRLFAWVVYAVVAVLLLSTGVQAAYKPVDISDITGEQRKALTKLWTELKRMPPLTREAFICEQLGLFFCKDYSQASRLFDGYLGTTNKGKACFVGRGGKVVLFWDAVNAARARWGMCYDATKQFKAEASLVPFKKEVQKAACSTAKYLLENMPKERRWMILASMGDMLYNDKEAYNRERDTPWKMENGINVKAPTWEGRDYMFVDPEGREHDIRALLSADNKDWRWRQVVWRCENLVGSKDILALFPEEVEAMRKHFKGRASKVKDEAKAKNDALLVAADEAMSSLPKEKRLARIALAMGLCYLDHRDAGCAGGYLNPTTTIILPDGSKHSGQEFVGETPGLLQQVPHEAILEYYRQPIEQMARAVAKERFKEMPPILRDLLRARLSRKLLKLDGSPAEIAEGVSTAQTFDRTWKVPMDAVDHQKTYFKDSKGQSIPYRVVETYSTNCLQTLILVNLCAQILGKEETVNLIPSGDVETKVDDTASDNIDGTTEEEGVPSSQTALGHTTRKGADTPQDKLLAQGQTALGEMTTEQRCAWLAEGMGFCFTEDGAPAYQSERTANANAVYVDAQGKVRKLSEVPGKDSPGWTAATNAARLVGYDLLTAPYKEEIRQLAVQTSKYILTSMSPELRQSWLAENNKLLFMPNAQVPYSLQKGTLESGIKVSHQGVGTGTYGKCMYYDPSDKIVSTTAVEGTRQKRWGILSYCETVAGIEAINAQFPAEVEAMRAAFQKSPFYKK